MRKSLKNPATFMSRPDVNIAIFAFLLNYPWEFLQVPFYREMPGAVHWSGVVVCSRATVGDAIIMLAAFWLTAFVARSTRWALDPLGKHVAVFILCGLLITLVIEHLAVRSDLGWRYAPNMPLVPLLGAGLAPALQWIVLPPLALWFVRRQVKGAEFINETKTATVL